MTGSIAATSDAPAPVLEIHYTDPEEGWEGFLVIDSLVDGISAGGCRMSVDVHAEEVRRLARTMTLKNRATGLPVGGAKCGVRADPQGGRRVEMLTRFFKHIRPICEHMYGIGPDMNTTAADLDAVADALGLASRHIALLRGDASKLEWARNYHEILRRRIGPLTFSEVRAGRSVAAMTERAAEALQLKRPLRVVVQGFGAMGVGVAWELSKAHRVVGIADASGLYCLGDGLDVEAMIEAKGPNGTLDPARLPPGVRVAPRDSFVAADCDVLVLAAVPDAVHRKNAADVTAKLVVEAGNTTVTPAAELILAHRGVLVIPDFIGSSGPMVTLGGIICMGWDVTDEEAVLRQVVERTVGALDKALEAAASTGLTLRQAMLIELGLV